MNTSILFKAGRFTGEVDVEVEGQSFTILAYGCDVTLKNGVFRRDGKVCALVNDVPLVPTLTVNITDDPEVPIIESDQNDAPPGNIITDVPTELTARVSRLETLYEGWASEDGPLDAMHYAAKMVDEMRQRVESLEHSVKVLIDIDSTRSTCTRIATDLLGSHEAQLAAHDKALLEIGRVYKEWLHKHHKGYDLRTAYIEPYQPAEPTSYAYMTQEPDGSLRIIDQGTIPAQGMMNVVPAEEQASESAGAAEAKPSPKLDAGDHCPQCGTEARHLGSGNYHCAKCRISFFRCYPGGEQWNLDRLKEKQNGTRNDGMQTYVVPDGGATASEGGG